MGPRDEEKAKIIQKIPLKRLASTNEVAQLIGF
jgi:hypothetical protein